MSVDVLTVSSKGQVVLPSKIRSAMSIETGDKLAVYVIDGSIIMKPVKIPSQEEMQKEFQEAQEWAASVGMTEDDITEAIKEVRARKREAK